MPESQKSKMSWWIWIAAFILLQLVSKYSIFFLYTPGTADVYLTFSIGIILIYWLGPRVLILVYLNTFLNSYYWGHENIFSWPIFGIPETTFVFLSWYLFIKIAKGKYWLPDLVNLIKFVLLGICIPLTVQVFLLKLIMINYGELDASEIWISFLNSWMGDFMPTVVITLPILFYLSKGINKWLSTAAKGMDQNFVDKSKYLHLELFAIGSFIFLLSFILDFKKYWYIYGLISLIVSVRHGFGSTTLINLIILITTYFIPAAIFKQTNSLYFNQIELIEIYLGVNLLSLFSMICGRVISDNRFVQYRFQNQIMKVKKINKELDSFVYSVSHDLSAPLKSIKGLTYLMRLDNNSKKNADYISKIEACTDRLDLFIQEILDYSRNSRLGVYKSKINLEQMVKEIIENHRYIDGFEKMNFDLSDLIVKRITTDEMRTKIILNNLISNAIKFSKGLSVRTVKVSSLKTNSIINITVEDNGHGISKEHIEKIFDIFYRASAHGSGSGLGLYIAKESANKINAKLTVNSVVGEGSKFGLVIRE